jgi:hypothetical protein
LKIHFVEELVAAFGLCNECCDVTFVVPKNRVDKFEVGTVDARRSTGVLRVNRYPQANSLPDGGSVKGTSPTARELYVDNLKRFASLGIGSFFSSHLSGAPLPEGKDG